METYHQRALVALLVAICVISTANGQIVEKEVLKFGATSGADVTILNDNNVATCIPLAAGNTAPWYTAFELKAMTADNQDIQIKWSLPCTHEHVYAMVRTNGDDTASTNRKCTSTGTFADDGGKKVCHFDCGSGMNGNIGLVRISHVTESSPEICEIQYI